MWYVIFGQNLATTREVYFSGEQAALNTTYVRDDNIIINIPGGAPFPNPNVLSTVRVITNYGEANMEFEIQQPPPVIDNFAPAVASPGEAVTIDGEFFNGLQSVAFVDVATNEVREAEIVSSTVDETGEHIVVIIPDGTKVSTISVTTQAGTGVSEKTFGLNYAIYTEGLNSEMQNWGWGGSDDFYSTTAAKSGNYSYKRAYEGGWTGVQLHHGTLDLTQFTHAKFSVYGGPGTTGKLIQFTINWGASVQIEVTEGEWVDYTIPLSDIGSPAVLDNFILQDNANSSPGAPYLIYLDDIGFL